MNCRENQICRIIKGASSNRIVRTLRKCSCIEATWQVEALQHLRLESGRELKPGSEACIPDSHLRPMGDEGPEEVDEMIHLTNHDTVPA